MMKSWIIKMGLLLPLCWSGMLLSQTANVNISNGILFDGEPYLAVNPTNSSNLVAAWMSLKLNGSIFSIAIKTRCSFDGGNNWSTAVVHPHMGTTYGSADASLAFDFHGLLYLSYIDYRESPDSGGVYVCRSFDGGLNWDIPSKAFDMYDVAGKRPIDRPFLVADKSPANSAGKLYMTTKPAPWIAPPNRNYFKYSSDSGHVWTPIASVDGGSFLVGNLIASPMAAPAVSFSGKFCAVYPSYVASQNLFPCLYFASSTNHGQSFQYSTLYSGNMGTNDTNFKNGYQLITHPGDSNKMFFVTPSALNGDADILAFHSENGGVSWSGPVRINDDALANGKGQDMVWASYNENGKIVVTWRDRRNASNNGFWNADYDFFYALSQDNGSSFTPNQKLNQNILPFDSLLAQNGNDFMSNVLVGDTLCTVWGDSHNGKMNIYFSKTLAGSSLTFSFSVLEGDLREISLYPNPAGDILHVDNLNPEKDKELKLFNMQGQVVAVFPITQKNMTIPLGLLPGGNYILSDGRSVKSCNIIHKP